MANYSTLKAAVADVVKTNGTQAITGANLQAVLLSIINSVGGGGYIFKGVATPSTDAGTPDENVFYIGGAGTYANFGTSVTVPVGSIGVFKYNGSWTKEQIALFAGIDDVPTANSNNLVKSGGVYDEIRQLTLDVGFPFVIPDAANLMAIYLSGGVGTTVPEPQASASFSYKRISVTPGDKIIINGTGGSGPRLWGFIDSNDIIISVSDAGAVANNLLLVVPENAAEIIINNNNTSAVSYYVKTDTLEKRVSDLENEDVLLKDQAALLHDGLPMIDKENSLFLDITNHGRTLTPIILSNFLLDMHFIGTPTSGCDYRLNYFQYNKTGAHVYDNAIVIARKNADNTITTLAGVNVGMNAPKGLEFREIELSNDSGVTSCMLLLDWDALLELGNGDGAYSMFVLNNNYVFDQKYIFSDFSYTALLKRVSALEGNVTSMEIAIPSEINAIVGDTLQLYYKSIFKCVDFSYYDINVTCDIGSQFPRYYEVTPLESNIGNHSITFSIKDNNNNTISSKTINLKVSKVVSSPANNINVLCIGASGTGGGQWVSEFKRRLTANNGSPAGSNLSNISFVGRREVTYGGIAVKLEATGGYTFSSYTSTSTALYRFNVTAENEPIIAIGDVYSINGNNYTISEINISEGSGGYFSCTGTTTAPATGGTLTKVSGSGSASIVYSSASFSGNPFVYNGAINVAQYATDYCGGNIDVIYTELFGNGSSPYTTNFVTRLTQMQTFITQFRTAFPNVKFCIGLQWNPDVRGGMGINYGASGGWSYGYGMKSTFMGLVSALQKYIDDNNLGSYVYIVNWMNEFDEENDFMQTMKPVNTRSNITEIFGVNGIHPSDVGYNQMADAAWRLFIAKFCQ